MILWFKYVELGVLGGFFVVVVVVVCRERENGL